MKIDEREVLTKESCAKKLESHKAVFIGMALLFIALAPACIAISAMIFREIERYFKTLTAEEINVLDLGYGGILGIIGVALIVAVLCLPYGYYLCIKEQRKLKKRDFLIVTDELIRLSEETHSRRRRSSGIEIDYYAHFAKTGRYHCGKNFFDRYSEGDLFYVVVLNGKYIAPYAVYSQQAYVCREVDDLYE